MQYIKRSCFASFTFELTNCDGSPVDLSNNRVLFVLKEKKDNLDENALLRREYLNSETNILSFQFTADETKNIPIEKGFLALKIYSDSGNNDEVWNDDVKIVRGVLND